MILRLSWTAIIFIAAISLSAKLGGSSLFAESNDSVARTAKAVANTEAANKSQAQEDQIFQMARDFESGEKSSESIQSELSAITGDSKPIKWDSKNIQGKFKLSQVLTQVHNLDNNFQLLFTHTLSDQEQKEDTVTHYSSRINEADEKSIGASIVFSRYIEATNGRPQFDSATRSQYFFFLKSDALKNSFNLREPEGAFEITSAKEDSFNPLGILNAEDGNFDEIGEYQYEIQAGETAYIVNVTPRLTDLETLTIEADIREVNSLTTTTFVLVYEQL